MRNLLVENSLFIEETEVVTVDAGANLTLFLVWVLMNLFMQTVEMVEAVVVQLSDSSNESFNETDFLNWDWRFEGAKVPLRVNRHWNSSWSRKLLLPWILKYFKTKIFYFSLNINIPLATLTRLLGKKSRFFSRNPLIL